MPGSEVQSGVCFGEVDVSAMLGATPKTVVGIEASHATVFAYVFVGFTLTREFDHSQIGMAVYIA